MRGGEGLARSTGARGRRRKKSRSWVLEISVGVAALTVGGLALGGPWLRETVGAGREGGQRGLGGLGGAVRPAEGGRGRPGGGRRAGEEGRGRGVSKSADARSGRRMRTRRRGRPSTPTRRRSPTSRSRKATKRVKDIRIVGRLSKDLYGPTRFGEQLEAGDRTLRGGPGLSRRRARQVQPRGLRPGGVRGERQSRPGQHPRPGRLRLPCHPSRAGEVGPGAPGRAPPRTGGRSA